MIVGFGFKKSTAGLIKDETAASRIEKRRHESSLLKIQNDITLLKAAIDNAYKQGKTKADKSVAQMGRRVMNLEGQEKKLLLHLESYDLRANKISDAKFTSEKYQSAKRFDVVQSRLAGSIKPQEINEIQERGEKNAETVELSDSMLDELMGASADDLELQDGAAEDDIFAAYEAKYPKPTELENSFPSIPSPTPPSLSSVMESDLERRFAALSVSSSSHSKIPPTVMPQY